LGGGGEGGGVWGGVWGGAKRKLPEKATDLSYRGKLGREDRQKPSTQKKIDEKRLRGNKRSKTLAEKLGRTYPGALGKREKIKQGSQRKKNVCQQDVPPRKTFKRKKGLRGRGKAKTLRKKTETRKKRGTDNLIFKPSKGEKFLEIRGEHERCGGKKSQREGHQRR